MTVIDLYPRLLTGPTDDNMTVTDLYLGKKINFKKTEKNESK